MILIEELPSATIVGTASSTRKAAMSLMLSGDISETIMD